MLPFIKNKRIWFILSGTAVTASIFALIVWGLNFGIDFTGGSLLEIVFSQEPPQENAVKQSITSAGILDTVSLQRIGEQGMILRFESVDEEKHQTILNHLKENFDQNLIEERFDSIGPSIGNELRRKTWTAIAIALIAIILYISWAFQKVSKPISSWKYGLIAIIALFHDIIIVLGVFSVLGKFWQVEISAPFIAALLTILGYSVNDTIVVFDRIRENLLRHYENNLEEIINKSTNESITRSINTSLTTIIILLAIFFFGGESVKIFSLALIIGIAIGTYSSLFLASPLLVTLQQYTQKR